MIRTQQQRTDLPALVDQPRPHHGRRKIIGSRRGQVACQQRPVPAQLTDHGGHPLVRLARRAVHPFDHPQLTGRIRIKPGDRQILALPPPVPGRDWLVAAGRAGQGTHRLTLADQPVTQLPCRRGQRLVRLPDPSTDRAQTIRKRRCSDLVRQRRRGGDHGRRALVLTGLQPDTASSARSSDAPLSR